MSESCERVSPAAVTELWRVDGPQGVRETIAEPRNRAELARFVRRYLGLAMPAQALCPHHHSPLDYLVESFLAQRDLVVWANRGGGKTMMAAAATVLDMLFRGPIQARVLGGSFDQSSRLATYIREILDRQPELIKGRPTKQRIRLVTGGDIQMLAQSQRAVRGQHAQKIRCDELDLFDPDVWQAVQFATRSKGQARGSIEVLSTLHRGGGLMDRVVKAQTQGGSELAGYKLVRWCVWDVIERCPPSRVCRQCPLVEDCQGIARRGSGFFSIDDAIAIQARSSRSAWEAEMLCQGVNREAMVFPEFDRARHVGPLERREAFPLFRAMDFGYRNPLVCLWIQLTPGGQVQVLDEYVRSGLPIGAHGQTIAQRWRCPVTATYVDPAGRQRESTSGKACTEILAQMGIECTSRASNVADGIGLIREALAPALGPPQLVISPRCTGLIDAFEQYHYGPEPGSETPVKDGPDHLIDALRYFFVNRMRPRQTTRRGQY